MRRKTLEEACLEAFAFRVLAEHLAAELQIEATRVEAAAVAIYTVCGLNLSGSVRAHRRNAMIAKLFERNEP
jgi:hypothetical protein